MHSLDCVDELVPGDRLGDVPTCTGPDDGDHVLGVVGYREREEALLGTLLGDLLDHLDAAAARHVDVEERDVGVVSGDRPHGALDGVRLAQHLDLLLELGLDARAEDPVIIDDHDGGGGAHRPFSLMLNSTSVPSPGSLRIAARPPCRFMRPIIDSRTPWRSSGTAFGSKPGPRSSMKTRASVSSTSA